MKLQTLSLQKQAVFAAKLKDTDTQLKAALDELYVAMQQFSSAMSLDYAGALAFCREVRPEHPDDADALRAFALELRDRAAALEVCAEGNLSRRKGGLREIELELIGAGARQNEIAAEIERIATALTACTSDAEVKRRNLQSAGCPAELAGKVFPDLDRNAAYERHADLIEERDALSRFVRTYNPKRLPASFGPWFEAWKTRCGVRPAEQAA